MDNDLTFVYPALGRHEPVDPAMEPNGIPPPPGMSIHDIPPPPPGASNHTESVPPVQAAPPPVDPEQHKVVDKTGHSVLMLVRHKFCRSEPADGKR